MRMLAITTLLMAAAAPGLAAAQTAMTLTCSGAQTLSRDDMAKSMSLPWRETFRIDPAHQRYCGARCGPLGPSDLADPAKIVLRPLNAHRLSQPLVYDKASGAVSSREVQDLSPTVRSTLVRTGTCKLSQGVSSGRRHSTPDSSVSTSQTGRDQWPDVPVCQIAEPLL